MATKEFPTAGHRQAYIDAIGREITAAERRLEQVTDGPYAEHLKAELTDTIKKAKAELARVKRSKGANDDEETSEETEE